MVKTRLQNKKLGHHKIHWSHQAPTASADNVDNRIAPSPSPILHNGSDQMDHDSGQFYGEIPFRTACTSFLRNESEMSQASTAESQTLAIMDGLASPRSEESHMSPPRCELILDGTCFCVGECCCGPYARNKRI
eukprot:gnl/MRDRNA2_/MRDRNA2_86248_c0_seq3.p2 gnl/MRDRNA2_/MRDRNA2_86248_c0~~gnl/MRDRNA2_/MRDRNA2_86248_c0_seq3.p2  ORF type:complete len:134 (-),score=18.50 gnl/MRDRNA2_/MRDRNA2_86248_c0_seq3:348-749(-)